MRHFLVVAASTVVVAGPALSDPAVRRLVAHHPGWAAYYPLTLAIVSAFARVWSKRNGRNGSE